MKKLYVFVIAMLLCANVGFCQCPTGAIYFYSQADVDNFATNYPGCTSIGGIHIYFEVANLDGLSQLTSVTGDVEIASYSNGSDVNYPLSDISGLYNLTSIGGSLHFYNVPNINGSNLFPNLTHIGGHINILAKTPAAMSGFNSLQTLDGNFNVTTEFLSSLSGFSSLTRIGYPGSDYGTFSISDSSLLTQVNGFGSLQYIRGLATITNNPLLQQLPNFSSLTQLGSQLAIQNNNSLQSISQFNSLHTMQGTLYLNSNAALQSISFPNLVTINEGLSVLSNPSLTTVNFPSLEQVAGTFNVSNNTILTNLGFTDPDLVVGSNIHIYSNPQLSVCNKPGFCTATNFSSVYDNAPGCNSVTQIRVSCGQPQNCYHVSLSSQQDVDNYPMNYGCTSLEGSLYISGNDITNLNGLSQLTSVQSLSISSAPLLTDFSGLNQLHTISGSFDVSGEMASNLTMNFSSLQTIGGNFTINNITALSTFSGFTYLQTIGGNFQITNNTNLLSFTGFGSLQTITGFYDVYNNTSMTALPTTTALSAIGGYFRITNNLNSTMAGLNALTSVGDHFNLYDNPALTNISALSNLSSINGQLYVASNPMLVSLSGLDNLSTIGVTGLTITSNPQLSLCNMAAICSLIPVVSNNITDNARGCNSNTQVLVSCGQPQNCQNVYLYSQQDVDNYDYNFGCNAVGELYISGSDIVNLNGLGQITSVVNLNLINLPALQDCSGLDNLVTITGNFTIDAAKPTTLSMLPNLISVGGNFSVITYWFYPPSMLTSLQGFTNLVSIGGNFEVYNNTSLTQLPSFASLTSVGGINISNNPQLTNLNALSHLTTVNGSIAINYNDTLNSIYGLNQMTTSGITSLQINGNPQLSLCNATSVCNYISNPSVYISANAAGCFSVAEVESSCTNQLPVYGGVSAPVYFCAGSAASVYIYGLFPNSVSTVGYRIGTGQEQTAGNVTADLYGNAILQIVFAALDEGETLTITSITRSDVLGETLNVAQNNTALLIRYPENTYYRDADSDGQGDPTVTVQACFAPLGYVSNQNDCDDTDDTKFVLITFYEDNDSDGYGAVNPVTFCTDYTTIPSGFVTNNTDCNDNNPAIHQLLSFYVDADHDGFGSLATALLCESSPPVGYSAVSGDCNDASASINPVAQRLEFSSSPNFSTSICAPLTGTIYTTFSFEAVYYDANNTLPPTSFPRVYLDYEGNGVLNDSSDRVVVMTPYDVNDLNTADGKRYIATINNLPNGVNWETRIQISHSGCLTTFGPFNYPDVRIDPDLQIFANDITLSTNHPAVSSPLTVSAVIRNASDYPTQSFYAHLVNQYDTNIVYGDVLVSGLAPQASTIVSWDIMTPAEPAWCPMQVVIDYTDVISETNEFNNSAVRPFINGNYNLLGGIDVINETISPEVSYAAPDTFVYVSGSGRYYDALRTLPDDVVSGATVNVRIVETGRTGFGYTNAYGDFFCSIPAPESPGIYHIEGEMTDFTFTGYFNLTFEKITPVVTCITDLSVAIQPASATIIEGQSVLGNVTVMNSCAAISSPTLLHFSQDSGSQQVSDLMVPALDPYDSFTTSFSNIVFNTPGTYSICATADGEFSISEANENNNSGCMIVTVLPNMPDIYPASGPSGSTCETTRTENFSVMNLGGVASGAFNCEIFMKKDEVVIGTYYETIAAIDAGTEYGFTKLINYPSPGNYSFELHCDYDHQLAETNEGNNIGYFGNVIVREPQPDIALGVSFPVSEFLCEANNSMGFIISNEGCSATGTFNCDILVKRDGILLDTLHETIAGIDAGSPYYFTKPFVFDTVGHYTFELRCDVNNAVTETDETNNTNIYHKYITACKPNLAFDSGCEVFDVLPVDPQHPEIVIYTATILNNGNATADAPIDVRFKITDQLYYDMAYSYDLAPGASAVLTMTVPSVAPATRTLKVMADYNNLIDEFSEDDNQIEGELCWDFQPVDRPVVCGDDFWKYSYVKHQEVPVSVAFNQYHLYDASSVEVKFEVSGPGLDGLVDLGTVLVNNIQQNCACPYVAALPETFVVPEIGTYTFVMTVDPNHVYTECDESNNVLIRSIQATTLPDLRVLSQYINPSLLNPDPGEPIQLDVTYENIGNSNISDSMQFKVFVDADLLYTTTVSGLPSGQNQTIHIPVNWSSTVVGTHTIRTVIDSGNAVVESDELNNTATRAIIVGEASNLYFQSFTTANYSPALNANIVFNAVIGNNGDLLCLADLQFYYINDAFQEIAIGTQHISVGANSSITIEMPWTVYDNDTTIYARIINPSTLEFNDEDNVVSLMIGKTDLSLKLFVEGYYNGAGAMVPVKLNQGVAGASADDVETLTVQLFDAVTLQPAGTTTAILHTNGSLDCNFSPPLKGNYYIVVKGGNVLQTWSALPKKLGAEPLYYDFSLAASQAYGDNMLEVESGVWAIYSGDINDDENINNLDFGLWETDASEFAFGDYVTDLNGDGNVDNLDFAIWETNAGNFIYSVYPMH